MAESISRDMAPVLVCVRVRPPPAGDCLDNQWRISSDSLIAVRDDFSGQKFTYEHVFDPQQTTEAVYRRMCSPVVMRSFNGVNCTIFAYGQTNSGKTYTICGAPSSPGIIAYAARQLFSLVEHHSDESDNDKPIYILKVSYMELYNEQLSDLLLLATKKGPRKKVQQNAPALILHDDFGNKGEGVVVENLTEYEVHSPEELIDLQKRGEAKRHIDRNNAHEYASRSHTVFRVRIEKHDFFSGAAAKGIHVSFLNIVDLAGSETTYVPFKMRPGDIYDPFEKDPVHRYDPSPRLVARRQEYEKAKVEGNNIRKSLLALVRVVKALAAQSVAASAPRPNSEFTHIPYRDSKLTRLLSNAVGGDSSTVIVCTVNPSEYRETIATLHFAADAQKINNRPKFVNVQPVVEDTGMYKNEILRLREQLKLAHNEKAELQQQLASAKRQSLHEGHGKMDTVLVEKQQVSPVNDGLNDQQFQLAQETWRTQQEDMQSQINSYQDELTSLRGVVNQRDTEMEDLQESLAQAERELEAKQVELDEALLDARNAEMQANNARSASDSNQEQITTLHNEQEQLKKQMVAERAESAHQLHLLQQKHNESDMNVQQLQADNGHLQHQISALQKEMDTLQRERNAMERYINHRDRKGKRCGCLRRPSEDVPGQAPWVAHMNQEPLPPGYNHNGYRAPPISAPSSHPGSPHTPTSGSGRSGRRWFSSSHRSRSSEHYPSSSSPQPPPAVGSVTRPASVPPLQIPQQPLPTLPPYTTAPPPPGGAYYDPYSSASSVSGSDPAASSGRWRSSSSFR
eukprot:TRINITY_DN56948_c0_g1_i1.p1 TRINITY_DN56948_c0_g1~~TRINITY_DN56948_c0_g1_i1.p1  ORF type:complete len:797 (-),score=55.87 TRINITY_DN56948_c0_g1_i1:1805-4195(-)